MGEKGPTVLHDSCSPVAIETSASLSAGHPSALVSPAFMTLLGRRIFARMLMAPPAPHASVWVPSGSSRTQPGLGAESSPPKFVSVHKSSSPLLLFLLLCNLSKFSFAFGKQKPERFVDPFFSPPYHSPRGQRSSEEVG